MGLHSHAQLPTPLLRSDGTLRVFFATRDSENRSHVCWADVDPDDPTRVIGVCGSPVLSPGPMGMFDGDGIYPASALEHDGKIWLYTIGWNAGRQPPIFYAAGGLAFSDDGGDTFQRHGTAPILQRSEFDPCLVTSPFVLREPEGWKMWYVSGYRWDSDADKIWSRYHIKYAGSDNGIDWHRDGHVCIAEGPDETNISRCWVVRSGDRYGAWFSSASRGAYGLGFASSDDGLNWQRNDGLLSFARSGDAWDATVIAYPAVLQRSDHWLMFYNGANFGKDGFGVATAPVQSAGSV